LAIFLNLGSGNSSICKIDMARKPTEIE